MNKDIKTVIDKLWNNIGLILAVVIAFTIFTMSAPNLDTAGLGGLANLFLPAVFGGITIMVYLISRIFIRKWNWVISLIGIVYIGYISVMLFFDKL